jgi:isoleucyl-tRNA synthetase
MLSGAALGASIHDVLARIKAAPRIYPQLHLTFSQARPLARPIVIALPHNGLRLRFDGIEQRLRLIEVLDFSKVRVLYKNDDIAPRASQHHDHPQLETPAGPKFRAVYKIFGPTTPGEYIPPADAHSEHGTYVLSYPGVAFSFPLRANRLQEGATWGSTVSLLSSNLASAATAMSVFAGESWQNVRNDIFTSDMSAYARSPLPAGHKRDITAPKEVELARI